MFIKRTEYEELKKEMQDLKAKVKCLGDLHNVKKEYTHCTFDGSFIYCGSHKALKFNTDHVKNVTLDELVKFVIDDEPIEREETVKVEYRK